uniref:Cytokinin dehydrogenase 1 FAD/cytokinin binding domain-containing protein n=1 Tax=Ananas comosus var. bracteatus TaxID=296719 RepID=A0A6V7QB27_ANACO|nr:unnamed protein product [Ananas comosus var. bracteatus]
MHFHKHHTTISFLKLSMLLALTAPCTPLPTPDPDPTSTSQPSLSTAASPSAASPTPPRTSATASSSRPLLSSTRARRSPLGDRRPHGGARGQEASVHGADFDESPYVDCPAASSGSMSSGRALSTVSRQSRGPTTSTSPSGGRCRTRGSAGRPSATARDQQRPPARDRHRGAELLGGRELGPLLRCSWRPRQFGVITRARIVLEPAPKMRLCTLLACLCSQVKWMRVLYSGLRELPEDQEMLIAAVRDVRLHRGLRDHKPDGAPNNCASSFKPRDPAQASQFDSDGGTLFCLEMTKNYDPRPRPCNRPGARLGGEAAISRLVEIPHPWLNLLIPKSRIHEFASGVFGKNPQGQQQWPYTAIPSGRQNVVVISDEEIFYLVGFLSAPSSRAPTASNRCCGKRKDTAILRGARIGNETYLPHYSTQEEWRAHFGDRWEMFKQRKEAYDPLNILAPGQRIFQKQPPPAS